MSVMKIGVHVEIMVDTVVVWHVFWTLPFPLLCSQG